MRLHPSQRILRDSFAFQGVHSSSAITTDALEGLFITQADRLGQLQDVHTDYPCDYLARCIATFADQLIHELEARGYHSPAFDRLARRLGPRSPGLALRDQEVSFQSCYSDFRSAIDRAGIKLPRGQLTHICRHMFASHFVMNGGHTLTLQKVLGHSDLKLTMRYAHLAPDFLGEVVVKGPKFLV